MFSFRMRFSKKSIQQLQQPLFICKLTDEIMCLSTCQNIAPGANDCLLIHLTITYLFSLLVFSCQPWTAWIAPCPHIPVASPQQPKHHDEHLFAQIPTHVASSSSSQHAVQLLTTTTHHNTPCCQVTLSSVTRCMRCDHPGRLKQ